MTTTSSTWLIAPLVANDEATLLLSLARAKSLGAEAIEVRLDHLTSAVDFSKIVASAKMPIVWTCRHPSEGGKFTGSEADRVALLIRAADVGGECIDIEFRRYIADDTVRSTIDAARARWRAAGRSIQLILSWHDFENMPDDLGRIVAEIEPHADIVKFAVTPKSIDDNFRVFDAARACRKPVVALAMGTLGQMSRILARKLNCKMSFAAIDASQASAPGQLTLAQSHDIYHWSSIDADTAIAGVIGHPVEHSLSPEIHNAAYRTMGFNGVYLRFDVDDSYDAFKRFVDALRSQPINAMGVSVTIPHKSNAIRYARESSGTLDPLAERIGAVNTLCFGRDGTLHATNTDYIGILRALSACGCETLAGKRVVVLGAGGVARAIVAAATSAGAKTIITNRTFDRAKSLADEFGCEVLPWERRFEIAADVVINGTSVGMWPKVDDSPLPDVKLPASTTVFDTVYNPRWTTWLKSSAGPRVEGFRMLVHQAAEQIRPWLASRNADASHVPIDVMDRVVLQHLDPAAVDVSNLNNKEH